MSHDYAKSPLIEDIEEDIDEVEVEADADVPADDTFSSFDPRTKELFEPHKFAPKDLLTLLKTIESDIHSCDDSLRDENEKRKKHRMDDCRRVHDYGNLFSHYIFFEETETGKKTFVTHRFHKLFEMQFLHHESCNDFSR